MAELIKKEVLKERDNFSSTKETGGLSFLTGLVKVRDTFLNFGSFHLNDGNKIHFWEDKWLGSHTLREQYSTLFNIVRKKHATVASVFDQVPLNVSF